MSSSPENAFFLPRHTNKQMLACQTELTSTCQHYICNHVTLISFFLFLNPDAIFVKWANLWRCTRIHEVNIRRWNLRLACCNESKVKRGQRVLCNDALTVWMSRTSGHITEDAVCVEHQQNVRLQIRYVWFSPQDRISDARRTASEQSSLSLWKITGSLLCLTPWWAEPDRCLRHQRWWRAWT